MIENVKFTVGVDKRKLVWYNCLKELDYPNFQEMLLG